MALLYICEYSDEAQTVRGAAPAAQENAATVDQTPVVIGAGSLQSAAFAATTVIVRIHTDAICSIKFGTNPTATTSTKRMNAGDTEYFGVPLNGAYKVAVIANT